MYNTEVKKKQQCYKPPMTGNGEFIPPIKIVMTGEWFMTLFFPLNFPIRMAILGVIPSYPDPHQKNLDHSPIRQI